ncbi:MAG: hypothetical protein V4549_17520, partial [Bacteroidota bacterium]
LVGYSKFLSNKVIVAVDSGQGVDFNMINDTDNTDAANASADDDDDDDDFPPVVATKNEKFYVKTSEKTYEGKTVQTDAKGSYIWKKVEIVAAKTEKTEKKIKEKVKPKVKVQTFPSMIEAMNFMSKNGWEFVQAYVTTSGNESINRWVLKKAK